jgi:hypothetical protein
MRGTFYLGMKTGLSYTPTPSQKGTAQTVGPALWIGVEPCPEPEDINQALVTWAERAKAESSDKMQENVRLGSGLYTRPSPSPMCRRPGITAVTHAGWDHPACPDHIALGLPILLVSACDRRGSIQSCP